MGLEPDRAALSGHLKGKTAKELLLLYEQLRPGTSQPKVDRFSSKAAAVDQVIDTVLLLPEDGALRKGFMAAVRSGGEVDPSAPKCVLISGHGAMTKRGGIWTCLKCQPGYQKRAAAATSQTVKLKSGGTSMAAFMREQILEGLNDNQVWKAACKKFGLLETDKRSKYPAWYRRELIKKGQLDE